MTNITRIYDRIERTGCRDFLILTIVNRFSMKKSALLSFLIAGLPFWALAHEGHGHTHGFTITHYFVEPEHLALVLLGITAAVLFVRAYAKSRKQKG